MTKKVTVGQEAVKRLANPDKTQTLVDTQREVDKEYFEEIEKCVKNHSHLTKPWYIVVHVKKEQLLENVIRRYFIGRESLPTPQWDETVWRYDPSNGDLRFLWCLPDENTAMWMFANPQDVPKEQHMLLGSIVDMLDGKLYQHYNELFHKGKSECEQLQDSSLSERWSQGAQVTWK